MLIGGVGGRIRLLLRAASALLDASSKVAATKIENVCFMGLPPFCVTDYAMEPPKQVFHPEDPMSQLLVALARGALTRTARLLATIRYKRETHRNALAMLRL